MVSGFCKFWDEKDDVGFDWFFWIDMLGFGWLGIVILEEYGGVDFGFVGFGLVMEEVGCIFIVLFFLFIVFLLVFVIFLVGLNE